MFVSRGMEERQRTHSASAGSRLLGLAFSSGAIAQGMSKSEYDATGCSLFHRAARMGYTTVGRSISGAAALGVPSGVLLNASAQPEERQDSDDDDDHADDVDDVGHDLLLRVR